MRNTYEALKNGFEILNRNREYWLFDNDYNRAFRIINMTVDDWERTTRESRFYVFGLLDMLLEANARIFKNA